MNILQIISLCLSIVTGSFTALTLISAPFRKWLLNNKREKEKENADEEERKETDRCLLRDRIAATYFKHHKECEMRQYEYENVARLYRQYKKLNGNSFVDKIWNEMQDWNIEK